MKIHTTFASFLRESYGPDEDGMFNGLPAHLDDFFSTGDCLYHAPEEGDPVQIFLDYVGPLDEDGSDGSVFDRDKDRLVLAYPDYDYLMVVTMEKDEKDGGYWYDAVVKKNRQAAT
jgi:hypothetical protein